MQRLLTMAQLTRGCGHLLGGAMTVAIARHERHGDPQVSGYVRHLLRAACAPLFGMLLLMAYPVPHKYDAGATFPRTATALGFTVGMVVGSRLLQLTACDLTADAGATCLVRLPRVPAMSCSGGLGGGLGDGLGGGLGGGDATAGDVGTFDTTIDAAVSSPSLAAFPPSQSKCLWAIFLRTCLGIACTLGMRLALSLAYAKYCRSELTGAFPSWSLCRPRLSGAAVSILRGANHRYNPSEEEAKTHLASLIQSVPLAASGTPVNVSGRKGGGIPRPSVSDRAAPQPPSPEDHHQQQQQSKQRRGKRGRRNRNNSHHDTSAVGRGRAPSAQQQELEAAAAAAAAYSSPSTGSVYGKYESAVPWNYVSNMLVGFTLAFVSPIVVSVFGG